jgi:nucleoside phosphorylase
VPRLERGGLTVRTVGAGASELDRLDATAGGASPRAVLVVGLAGGCEPSLRPGDVVVGDPVADQDARSRPSEADAALRARAVRALDVANLRYRVGPLLTVNVVAATPAEKAGWWRARGALAVDMESAHVMAWARRAGLPAVSVRAIADGPDEEVPPDLLRLVGAGGRVETRAVAGLIVRPALAGAAWRMGRRTRAAMSSLARFVQAFVVQADEP